ncbi:MAG: TldD/PmbA family protein [archaeon]
MSEAGTDMETDFDSLLKQASRVSEQAEIIAAQGKSIEISAESGAFSDVSEEEYSGFGIRVIRKGRVGFSFGSRIGERFGQVLSRAVENAGIGGKLSGLPEKPGKYPKVSGLYDGNVALLSGKDLIERVREIVGSAKRTGAKPTYSGAEASSGEIVVANSNGVFARSKVSSVSGGCYANAEGSTGFEGKASRKDNLDYPAFGRLSGERAVEGRHQRKFGTGKNVRIILHPYAVEGLLGGALLPSIDGENVFRGNSSLDAGKIGNEIFSENFSLEDNGLLPGENGSAPFDSEGVPCRRTAVFERGVLKNFLYNWETSRRAGTGSTGNGFRGFASTPKIGTTNAVVLPGKAREKELAKDADLSVLWLSGTHTINPFSGEFSVEAKNSFAMRRGERAFPTKPGIISGNIFQVLKTVRVARDGIERAGGGFITPPVLIEGDFVS